MPSMTTAMREHIESELTTLCTIWRVERLDGKVFCFTDYSENIEYQDLLYYSSMGYTPSAIRSNSSLTVDNLEVKAPLGNVSTALEDISSTILTMTDSDIQAGLWDYAEVNIWRVNYFDLSATMGHIILKTGTLGQINTGRTLYTAELRGMTQPLQQAIGRVYTSGCAANFGDSNCRKDKAAYTFTGSVTEYLNQRAWQDTSLNQTNSDYSKPILTITNTNPAIVSCTAHGLTSGENVTFSGVAGMTNINGLTFAITYLTVNTFQVEYDGTTSAMAGFGGVITKLYISEYFKDGVVTWLTGKNAGTKHGVKTYRPNLVELYEQMVYDIEVGDTYTILAGCDKNISTCDERFDNVINYYGFNLIPGQDRFLSGT